MSTSPALIQVPLLAPARNHMEGLLLRKSKMCVDYLIIW